MVRCVRWEVSEGLSIIEPCLFGFLGGVGVVDGGVRVCFVKKNVSLFAEFLEWLGRHVFGVSRRQFFEGWFWECVFI